LLFCRLLRKAIVSSGEKKCFGGQLIPLSSDLPAAAVGAEAVDDDDSEEDVDAVEDKAAPLVVASTRLPVASSVEDEDAAGARLSTRTVRSATLPSSIEESTDFLGRPRFSFSFGSPSFNADAFFFGRSALLS
jgi:hypothetical protein